MVTKIILGLYDSMESCIGHAPLENFENRSPGLAQIVIPGIKSEKLVRFWQDP